MGPCQACRPPGSCLWYSDCAFSSDAGASTPRATCRRGCSPGFQSQHRHWVSFRPGSFPPHLLAAGLRKCRWKDLAQGAAHGRAQRRANCSAVPRATPGCGPRWAKPSQPEPPSQRCPHSCLAPEASPVQEETGMSPTQRPGAYDGEKKEHTGTKEPSGEAGRPVLVGGTLCRQVLALLHAPCPLPQSGEGISCLNDRDHLHSLCWDLLSSAATC